MAPGTSKDEGVEMTAASGKSLPKMKDSPAHKHSIGVVKTIV